MATHLSARLTWHENAWNGRICDHPALNAACMFHEHIRKTRQDDVEEANHGAAMAVLGEKTTYLPPCQRDINAFGDETFFMPNSNTRTHPADSAATGWFA
jgi:hypothetical protein